MDTGFATGINAVFLSAAGTGGAAGYQSGQEKAHQTNDYDDADGAVFHQHDEAFVGLLMGRIIVAVSGRVGHFVMLCHRCPRECPLLACNYRNPTARATAMLRVVRRLSTFLLAGLTRPIVPDPAGEAFLADFAGRKGEDDGGGAFGWDQKIYIVEAQKYDERTEGRTLVAVDKRMIPGNAEGIRCRKRGKVSFAIGKFVDGTAQRRFQHALVTNAVRSSEQSKLFGVEINQDLHVQPDRLVHFARAL